VDFLGYGVDPSKQPTWGNILTRAQDAIVYGNWWWGYSGRGHRPDRARYQLHGRTACATPSIRGAARDHAAQSN